MKRLIGVLLVFVLSAGIIAPALAEDTAPVTENMGAGKKFAEKRKEIQEKFREKKENWKEFREKIREHRKEVIEIKKERYEERKELYKTIRERGLNDTEVFNSAKEFIISGIDLAIEHLNEFESRAVNLNLSEEEEQLLIENAETIKAVLEDHRAEIDNATTPQELRDAHKAFLEDWKLIRAKMHALAGLAMAFKLDDVTAGAQERTSLIEEKLNQLEERGVDVSKARDALARYEERIANAQGSIEEAVEKFQQALDAEIYEEAHGFVVEGKNALMDGMNEIKHSFVDLKNTFKEVLKSARDFAKEMREERKGNEGSGEAVNNDETEGGQ